ncbi:MAG: cytochrome c [Chloroflexota bacterium]
MEGRGRAQRFSSWVRKTAANLSPWQRVAIGAGAVFLVFLVAAGAYAFAFFQRDEPERHENILDHFKYGSIGAEAGAGVPYWIWVVLPDLFPQYLPDRPGDGYERIGFIYESPDRARPIGTGYRDKPIGLVGLNCAVCHSGTVRDSPDSEPQIVLGMPATRFDLQAYARFLFASAQDDDFNADNIMQAIDRVNPDMSVLERMLYRYRVIPEVKGELIRQSKQFAWMDDRPPSGPGRVDTFNPFNQHFGFDPASNSVVGTADLPSLWNQEVRADMNLHWDGNNSSVDERNINAAIGAGAIKGMEDNIDLQAIQRVADWAWDQAQPAAFPEEHIDRSLAPAGEAVYRANCATCHALDGELVGQVTDISDVGTDRERLDSVTPELIDFLNQTGEGKPWAYSHFRKTNGYANMPLDGIWLRAPYLHNGSVPTLRDLLDAPEDRPDVFYTAYDVYDYEDVGFVSSGPAAEEQGVLFDTSVRGNGNQGHTYGVGLSEQEKSDLLEYLKTQ